MSRGLGVCLSQLLRILSDWDEVDIAEQLALTACWAKGWADTPEHPLLPCSSCSRTTLGPKEGQENPLCSGKSVQSLVAIAATATSSSSEPGQQLSWAWALALRSQEQRSTLYVGGLSHGDPSDAPAEEQEAGSHQACLPVSSP